jgi:hypothetical protein
MATKTRRKPRKTQSKPKKVDTSAGGKVAESMFLMWDEGATKAAVRKKFKVSESTISRIAKRDKWGKRKAVVVGKTQTANNQRAARRKITNAVMAEQVRDKAYRRFMQLMDDNKGDMSGGDIVRIMSYCDSIGVGTDAGQTDIAHGNPKALAKALDVVKDFSGPALRALGDWIVANFATPEDVVGT